MQTSKSVSVETQSQVSWAFSGTPSKAFSPAFSFPPRTFVWPVFLTFAAVMGISHAVGILSYLVLSIDQDRSTATPTEIYRVVMARYYDPRAFLSFMALNSLLVAAAAVLPTFFLRQPIKRQLAIAIPRLPIWVIGLASFGIMGIGDLTSMALAQAALTPRASEIYTTFFSSQTPWSLGFGILIVGVLGPIAEELLFRGLIQNRLIDRWGPYVGIAITSALFGVYHRELHLGLASVAMGVCFGFVAYQAKSIAASASMHIVNNTAAIMWRWLLISNGGAFRYLLVLFELAAFAIAVSAILARVCKRPIAEPTGAVELRPSPVTLEKLIGERTHSTSG